MSDLREGEIRRVERCHGITLRRGAKTRCKHMTARGTLCHQHLKADKALRITNPEPSVPYRLYTTELIPKGGIICQFTGDTVVSPDRSFGNPFSVQVKERPRTFIDARRTDTGEARYAREVRKHNSTLKYNAATNKLHLVADRDIEPNEEITCTHEVVKKYVAAPEPVPEPKVRKPRVVKPKTQEEKQGTKDQKFEKEMIGRILLIQQLFNDPKLADKIGVALKPRTIAIPRKGEQQIDAWHDKLEKKLREMEKKVLAYFTQTGMPLTIENVRHKLDVMAKKAAAVDPTKY